MDVGKLLIATVAVKGVFRRYAALSNKEKKECKKKVKEKLKEKADKEAEAISKPKPKKKKTVPKKKKTKAKPKEKVVVEEVAPVEEFMGAPESDNRDQIIKDLEKEVESVAADGKIERSEIVGLFDKMMSMVNLLIDVKAPRKKRATQDEIEDEMIYHLAQEAISEKIASDFLAKKGLQMKRKDKDMMTDTGGSSKGREREPHSKPPREKNRFKPKKQMETDSDLEEDPDKRPD